MKVTLFLSGVIVTLVFNVSAIPLAPTSQSLDQYPGPQRVRMTHVKEWVADGQYGDVEKIDAIDTALTYCHKQLAEPKGSILHPKIQYLKAKASLLEPPEKVQACAKFVKFVHKTAPKGAQLHVHFNAILPVAEVWDIAVTQGLLENPS